MRNSVRRATGTPKRPVGGTAVGHGVAALLTTAALLLTGIPAAFASTGATAPTEDVAPGAHTETPSLVSGLHEEVPAAGSPADAARGHLKAKKGRYRIADPAGDLKVLDTQTHGQRETVRLQQRHEGVPVLGGEYVVRMEKKNGERAVTGTSGKYFTELKLDSVTPEVSEKTAIERAVAAVASQPGGLLRRSAEDGTTSEARLSGSARGLVILPQGDGVLTRHITVTGVNPTDGSPVRQEVYVDGRSGYPVLQYSGIKSFGTKTAAAGAAAGTADAGIPSDTVADQPVVKGTGIRYNGEKIEVNLYRDTKGVYQTIDYSKRPADAPYGGAMLATYDARGREANSAAGGWPTGITTFRSATPELGKDFTDAGAIDAHWAAGKVYDYYKDNFGRAGLDGKDGYVYSLVGVVSNGQPYSNAFWDGTKMVYGQGGGEYRTFSADTDVVGHEMTHGVIEHTADLVYAGQSGALNEALADYFGNAIDVETGNVSMEDPDSGLLGEDLCVTRGPRECALRDLNDGATTSKDFLGVTFRGDNGGVHLNSTIFSGALWDMRQDLGGDLADRIVYRALSAYMTPLDGFTEGRAAVLAAAQELGATKAQLAVVKRSFDAHGIVPGWEKALGIDTDTILSKVNVAGTGVGAGGGKYVVSNSDARGNEPYSVWLGNTSGQGRPQLMSENNGNYNVYADTDGTTVAWAEYSSKGILLKTRPVKGGVVKTLGGAGGSVSALAVDGDYVVYTVTDPTTGLAHVGYVQISTGKRALVDGGRTPWSTSLPSVRNGKIAYAKLWPESTGFKLGVEVLDAATGRTTLMPIDKDTTMGVGQTALTDDGVYWIEDADITDTGQAAVRRAGLDGSDPVTVTPESGAGSLYAYSLTASDEAVSVTTLPPATSWANDTLPKLYQATPDGKGGARRVSCNRGDQVFAAAAEGRRVLWLDGTTGSTNLVKRDRPAGAC
ncbi:M4 family metallopeptidase [Streptomyces anulatus]|uniref:M4 family metallopeptidase n=1 Tax=Streptomyces anulatus TaxID=1892 RepID=UPI0038693F01|nr:M4 family metallopeptidase [Streptomyces anulatus]